MKLTEQQEALLEFVKKMHGDQKRKYTGEPYWMHPLAVAEIVSKYENGCIEVALCHDLYEDTGCDFSELYRAMVTIGYKLRFAYDVCTYVRELSDIYTRESYPHLNREKRKILEAGRLGGISPLAQSVKYADLIHNTESIVKEDPKFSETYLPEKEFILKLMTSGNPKLFSICLKHVLKND